MKAVAVSDLYRVSVYADAVGVDLVLPAGVPVATLMPSIVDIVTARGYRRTEAVPYRLAPPGGAALNGSMTLAQLGIRDGAVLVLARSDPEPPTAGCDDAAEVVAAVHAAVPPGTSRTTPLWRAAAATWLAGAGALTVLCTVLDTAGTRPVAAGVAAGLGCTALVSAAIVQRAHRDAVAGAALTLWATGFAAVAGFLAVPGGPGAANVLLAAVAAAAVSVLAARLVGCGAVLLTAVSTLAVLAAVAALAAVITGVPVRVIGPVGSAVSVGLLQLSARTAITAAGLAPRWEAAPTPDQLRATTVRAHDTLTGLVAALSTATALGAVGTALSVARPGGLVFAGLTGAALLLRIRSHSDRLQVLTLAAGGGLALSAAGVAVAVHQHPLGNCAVAAALLTAALYGCRGPWPTLSPVAHRAVEVSEYLVLAAIAPLTCWLCGLFGAARGLDLR